MLSLLYGPVLTSVHDHWKNHSFDYMDFVGKVISLLSRLVITFLPRSKCLLISWLQSPSAVILEPRKIKSVTVSIVKPSICHEVMGPDAMLLVSWTLCFKPCTTWFYFFFKDFLMWTILKAFIEFITVLLLFNVFFFFLPQSMWGLSSPTRERTHTPCIGKAKS